MKVMGSGVRHIFRLCVASLGDLFFPRMCIVCGSKLDMGERHICPRCADDIPFTYFWSWEGNPAEQRLAALAHIDQASTPARAWKIGVCTAAAAWPGCWGSIWLECRKLWL